MAQHQVKIYRIRRKKDGLFSKGGSSPTFSKKGKIWQGMGPLKNHLTLVLEDHLKALKIKRITVTTRMRTRITRRPSSTRTVSSSSTFSKRRSRPSLP